MVTLIIMLLNTQLSKKIIYYIQIYVFARLTTQRVDSNTIALDKMQNDKLEITQLSNSTVGRILTWILFPKSIYDLEFVRTNMNCVASPFNISKILKILLWWSLNVYTGIFKDKWETEDNAINTINKLFPTKQIIKRTDDLY